MEKPNILMVGFKLLSAMVFFLVISLNSTAQEVKIQIRLLDKVSDEALTEVHFQYGSQKGVSDREGLIILLPLQDEPLYLSHITYGNHKVDVVDLSLAFEEGKLNLEARNQVLLPVTVISFRPRQQESESLIPGFQDRLSHDAGAFLTADPSISAIRKSGNYGFDPVMRGFKYEQLNLVIDGAQCATAACPNRMDPQSSQIAMNMLESVEVIKGPHSLRYGNAFGGTLNFISATPDFAETFKVRGRISSGYESNKNKLRSEGRMDFIGKAYDVSIFGSWSQGDDYVDGEGNTIASSFRRGSGGTNLAFKVSERQQLTFSLTRNLARDVEFASLPMDLRSDDTWLANVKHSIQLDKGILTEWNSIMYFTHVDHEMDNLEKDLMPRMVNAKTEAETWNYGARTEATFSFGKSYLYAGADMKGEAAEGLRTREMLMGPLAGMTRYDNVWQNSAIQKGGLFAEYHLNQRSMYFVFSGRLELNHANALDIAPEFEGEYTDFASTQLNIGISAGLIHNFSEGLSLGLFAGRVMRSGSLTERFINYFPVGLDPYEMLGNPAIDPEINNQIDLTLEWRSSKSLLKADFFFSYLQDFISSVIRDDLLPRMPSSPGVRQFVNLNEAMLTGAEFSFEQQLPFDLYSGLSLAYTYGKNLDAGGPLPEIAPLDIRFKLGGNFLHEKLQPEIGLRYVGTQDRTDPNFGEMPTPDFFLMDISLYALLIKNLGISIGVQNVLDEGYYEHLSRNISNGVPLNSPGRNFFVTLSLDFMD